MQLPKFLAIAILLVAAQAPVRADVGHRQLLACGDDQVRLYDWNEQGAQELWRWQARTSDVLPEEYRDKLLVHIDDCKSVLEGRAVLVTSSTGGVVLLDRTSGAIWFRAKAPMAHSATMLPGDRIGVALSIDEQGNRLEIYDRSRSEQPLYQLPLPSGHGLVWDAGRQRLFALSFDLVQSFSLVDWNTATPRLKEEGRWTLPGKRNGHDLSFNPANRSYLITTQDGVWTFDPERGAFRQLPGFNPMIDVKSISRSGNLLAVTKAEESWWAYGFTIASADGKRRQRFAIDGLHLYKVRWLD